MGQPGMDSTKSQDDWQRFLENMFGKVDIRSGKPYAYGSHKVDYRSDHVYAIGDHKVDIRSGKVYQIGSHKM